MPRDFFLVSLFSPLTSLSPPTFNLISFDASQKSHKEEKGE